MKQTSWLLADRWPEWGRAAARREDSVYLSTPPPPLPHPLFPLTLTGATATVSTLATVVGQPKTPADRGGERRGEEGKGEEGRGGEGRGGEGRGGERREVQHRYMAAPQC